MIMRGVSCTDAHGELILAGMGGSAANAPTSPDGIRASDAERDEAVEQLKEQFVAGRLSQDTFLARVHGALSARRSRELKPLLADLPEPAERPSMADRVRERARALATPVADAVREAMRTARYVQMSSPVLPLYFPPDGTRSAFTIGREERCDLTIADTTVSRVHARLTRSPDGWLLADLGSTNGTRVNGWRVREPAVVRAGDRVRFGAAVFVMRDVP